MGPYLLRRLLIGVFTFLLITIITFCVIRLAPGDPAELANSGIVKTADAKTIEQTRKHFGLYEQSDLYALMDGHEHAFARMGGCAAQCKYDSQKPVVLRWEGNQPIYNPRFLAFSSHKLCGPSGIGVLWGREELLDAMPPFLGGGNMIADVRLDGFTPAALPAKFEAGTPPITESVGLATAIDYLDRIGMVNIRQHEMEMAAYAMPEATSTSLAPSQRANGPHRSWPMGIAT